MKFCLYLKYVIYWPSYLLYLSSFKNISSLNYHTLGLSLLIFIYMYINNKKKQNKISKYKTLFTDSLHTKPGLIWNISSNYRQIDLLDRLFEFSKWSTKNNHKFSPTELQLYRCVTCIPSDSNKKRHHSYYDVALIGHLNHSVFDIIGQICLLRLAGSVVCHIATICVTIEQTLWRNHLFW